MTTLCITEYTYGPKRGIHNEKKHHVYSVHIAITIVAFFVTLNWIEPEKEDIDRNGILNTEDVCPEMFGSVHYLGCDVIEKAIHKGVTYYAIDHVEEINQNLSGFFHAPFVWGVKTPPCLPGLQLCFDS